MASPVWQSVSSGNGVDTTFTASEPSGAADGNALVLWLLLEDTFSGLTGATGWTKKGTTLDVGPFSTACYVIRRSGAPDLTWSWTTSRYFEWSLHRVSGIVSSGEFVEAFVEGTPTTGSEPNPPSATATTAETLAMAAGFTWAGWGGSGATAPASYTLRYGPASVDHAVATRALASAGAEDPGNFTGAGSDSIVGITMILASTSGGGGGGGDEAPVDHTSTLSFPALCRKPRRDDRWVRSQGGLWTQRKAA